MLEAIVEWDPGPRLNPLLAATVLFGVPSVILATATPIAVRLRARSVASVGKTAGRLFAVSTAGSIAGTFVTAFWLIPEIGTNQLLGLLATALFVAAGFVALGERKLVSGVVVAALVAGSAFATLALAPETGGRLAGASGRELVAALPARVARRRASRRRPAASSSSSRRTRATTASRSSRTAWMRHLRFESSFQSGMYLDDPFRTRVPLHGLPPAAAGLQPADQEHPVHRARRRFGAEAHLARLSAGRPAGRRARSGGARRGVSLLRASPQPAAGGRCRGRPPLPRARPAAVGRDRHRRLLLGLASAST